MFVRVIRDSSYIESLELLKACRDFECKIRFPVDLIATQLREEAINNIRTATPPTGIINRFINLWSSFPNGEDTISACYRTDPKLAKAFILQALELTLIAADISRDTDAIQKSVYNICRFIDLSDYSQAPAVSEPHFDSFFNDYLQDLESDLAGFRGILCKVIINNPGLMPILEQHTDHFPELQALIYRDFFTHFAYKTTLSASELKIACCIQVGADRVIKLIDQKYVETEDYDGQFEALEESHSSGHIFNEKLALIRACFNARHISQSHAADYCLITPEADHCAIVRAFMLKYQDKSPFELDSAQAFMSEADFLEKEKSIAFRTLFVSELIDLRLQQTAEVYFDYLEMNSELQSSHQTFRLTFLCKLVNGFAEVNFLKANHYLDQVCNYLDFGRNQEQMLNEIFQALKPSFEVPYIQERLVKEFTNRFSPEAYDLVDLEVVDDFYQGLIISKRFDLLEKYSSYLASFYDDTDLLVNAYLEGVANLYERKEFDAATQAFELACQHAGLDPDRPKIDWQMVIDDFCTLNQTLHFFRSALMVRSYGFTRHVLKGFQLAVNNCEEVEKSSEIALKVNLALSEEMLRRSGHLAHPLLHCYFENYLGVLGVKGLNE